MTETLPDWPSLPVSLSSRGGDARLLGGELQWVIREAITNHPRSQQTAIGPSEVGTPCLRKLAYRLAETPQVNERIAWRPTVGTAVHAWLADAFTDANASLGHVRFLTEQRVNCGLIGGRPLLGTVDLYDMVTATVVDWKIVGPTTLRNVRASGVPAGYATQVQLYGRGVVNRGAPVDVVGVMFLPVSGELRDAVWKPTPYTPSVAVAALERADAIALALEAAGPSIVLGGLPTLDDYCTGCPWFRPGSTDPATGCPGVNTGSRYATAETRQMRGLLP